MKRLLLAIFAFVVLANEIKAQEDMNATPLSFEAVEDGTVITITNRNGVFLKYAFLTYLSADNWREDVSYSLNETLTLTLAKGAVLNLRAAKPNTFSGNFTITASKDVYVYGNPLSLVSQADYPTMTDLSGCPDGVLKELFCNGWDGNPHIKHHPTRDIVLPATTLSNSCYYKMVQGTGLTRAPLLPAMTLTNSCYNYMFWGCKDLVEAPALPATTLADECYYAMFYGCSALTEAPALPATTLTYGCYGNMFRDCTSLTSAPVLPASTLVQDSYYWMFYGCKNLKYLKCLATDISAISCTDNMLGNVSPTGTFVKADGMNDWTRDYNGIPEGWTIINASEEPTAIDHSILSIDHSSDAVYDLQGRLIITVNSQLPKGVYIVNGKKISVR